MKAIKGVEGLKEIKAVDRLKGVETVLRFVRETSISDSYKNLHCHTQHAHVNENRVGRREEKRTQTTRERMTLYSVLMQTITQSKSRSNGQDGRESEKYKKMKR